MQRIQRALDEAVRAVEPFLAEPPKVDFKSINDPVTEADRTANCVLREVLLRHDEGWLSEESVDDRTRLSRNRIWIVDPIDGTREFVSRIPEWCISVAFVENGRAIAGGICNPVTCETFIGAIGEGITLNGVPVSASRRPNLKDAVILASRSELARGEWDSFRGAPFITRPMGSVAYKLALVAAGKADATWTFCPKNEWDVAGGSALVEAAGGIVRSLDGSPLHFNNPDPIFSGLLACGALLHDKLSPLVRERN